MGTERINLSDFNQVDFRGAFRFDIVKSDIFGITLSKARFKQTRVSKDGGALILYHPWWDIMNWFTPWMVPKVKVEMPELRGLSVAGASHGSVRGFASPQAFMLRIRGASRLTGSIRVGSAEFNVAGASRVELDSSVDTLKLKVAGASQFSGSMKADNATIEVVGASNLRLSGSIGDVVVKGAGASHLELADLLVRKADIKLAGASRCSIDVQDRLDAEVAGASRLVYGGTPVMGNVKAVGASTLTKS
jgi:hypothetical protein